MCLGSGNPTYTYFGAYYISLRHMRFFSLFVIVIDFHDFAMGKI